MLLLCIGPTNMMAVPHPSRNIEKQEEEQSLSVNAYVFQ